MISIKNKNPQKFTIEICMLIVGLAVVSIICHCFAGGISGNDFWWHIKVGEYVCENKLVPTKDIFSWIGIQKGIDWTAHEWLSDVIFYNIYTVFEGTGIFLLCIILAFVMSFLLMKEIQPYLEKNILIGSSYLLLFSILTIAFFYGRPHIFSFFLLYAELKILYEFYNNQRSKIIYLVPVIAILWSNLHGGSSNLSYLLCFAFAISGLKDFRLGRIESKKWDRRSLLILTGVGMACVVAILINPVGLEVLKYPYVNLSDNISMTMISEWQAPDIKKPSNLILFFFPIVMLLFGIVCGEEKIRLIDLLILSVFVYLFLRSARFIVLWYIVAPFCAFRYVPLLRIKEITKKYERITAIIVAILMMIPVATGVGSIVKNAQSNPLISTVMNASVIEVIKNDSPKRLYNDYNLGEALIYNDIPVFFDARADLYAQENIMADGIAMMFLQDANNDVNVPYINIEELINKYQFDAFVTLKKRPLYVYMLSQPTKFDCIYEDEKVAYFRSFAR